jgi:hypothetical protein
MIAISFGPGGIQVHDDHAEQIEMMSRMARAVAHEDPIYRKILTESESCEERLFAIREGAEAHFRADPNVPDAEVDQMMRHPMIQGLDEAIIEMGLEEQELNKSARGIPNEVIDAPRKQNRPSVPYEIFGHTVVPSN